MFNKKTFFVNFKFCSYCQEIEKEHNAFSLFKNIIITTSLDSRFSHMQNLARLQVPFNKK